MRAYIVIFRGNIPARYREQKIRAKNHIDAQYKALRKVGKLMKMPYLRPSDIETMFPIS